MNALLKPNPGIMDINPYIGGEAKIEGVTQFIRLASNENPLGCSEKAKQAYLEAVDELHRYPNGGADILRGELAKQNNIPMEQIVCGAGSEELITMLIRAYAGVGDEVLFSQHGFLMYPIATKAVGATPVSAPETNLRTDIDALLSKVTDKTKLLFIANPNNPTGSYITRDEIITLREKLPKHILLVIDAAYAEFADDLEGYSSGIDLVDKYPNIATLRTFSKIHGLASLRLGWGYFSKEVADVLNRIRGPFNVNAIAQITGVAALNDKDFIAKSIAHNSKWRSYLETELGNMGVETYPSAGNFLLANFGKDAEQIRQSLRNQGIFIRQMGAYNLSDCLRITVGSEKDNKALCCCLTEILK